jgi:hypothetical protein
MVNEPAVAGENLAWPWIASALFCFAMLGVLIALSIQRCGGHFGYPMDDTYIHMAMAKHFSAQGVWGTTKYGFTSSTSSPLYTLLLSATYLVTGVHEITPLILNLLAGTALLVWCDFALKRELIGAKSRFYLLAFLVFATPLPILILGGMEHTLHALLTLLFVHLVCIYLTSSTARLYESVVLIVLAGILAMTRYEAVFLVAAAGVLCLIRGRWAMTIGLALGGSIPVCAYGAVSMMHGWFPLPTSLLLKANVPSAPLSGMNPGFILSLFRNMSRGFHVLMLVLIAAALLHRMHRVRGTIWSYNGVGLILFGATALMHLTFARTGWFFRYEAYLIVLGVITVPIAIWDVGLPHPRPVWMGALALFACLVTARTGYAFYVAPQAIEDIYDQQYQMGLFAQENLNGKTVLINDIGAVSFLSDARVLDLIGLGSLDSARARIDRKYSVTWLEHWVKQNQASVAIVYPNLAPPEWRPIATWKIPGNYMSGSDSVNFFALDPSFQSDLVLDLKRFEKQLPPRVVVN